MVLVRWAIAFVLVIIAIFTIVMVGQLYLSQSKKTYTSQIKDGQKQLKEQKLKETQAQVQNASDSIKLAVDVLSKQILFSKVINQIGATLPEGSVLTGLSINQVEGGIELNAAAKDYKTATQVQLNLQDPNNKIFEKADILNVECGNGSGGTTGQINLLYPCKISIRALFMKNNSFLFINKDRKNEQ